MKTITETYPVVDGLPLRLSLTPTAIREHYYDCARVQGMSDKKLRAVGGHVLNSDEFYRALHAALTAAFEELYHFDPDEEVE